MRFFVAGLLKNHRLNFVLPVLVGAFVWAVLPAFVSHEVSADNNTPTPGTGIFLVAQLTSVTPVGTANAVPNGRADYRAGSNTGTTNFRSLDVFVAGLNLQNNTVVDVVVGNATVGQIRLQGGYGFLHLDTNRGTVPTITAGNTIAIKEGNTSRMTGTFAVPPTPSPSPTGSPRPSPSPTLSPSPRPSPWPARVFSARLSGSQVIPPVTTNAVGNGHIYLNQSGTQIHISLFVSGLSSTRTGASINGPALPGENGPVIFNLGSNNTTPGTVSSQTFAVTAAQVADLRAGKWYFNVRSVNHPNGEIRGQIKSANRRADFEGDGKADVSIFKPDTGDWMMLNSSNGVFRWETMGNQGDVNVVGDYDGDGTSDIAVFRPDSGTWYLRRSLDGAEVSQQWGVSTDVPIVGDYDGDGRADFTVYRPAQGIWYVLRSSDNTMMVKQWGLSADIPIAGDFDGDGRTDIGIYRPWKGAWWVQRSSDGSAMVGEWGVAGDVPVVGDFDGDDRADYTVWRPGDGNWYIYQSSNGSVRIFNFGFNGDIPCAAEYDEDNLTDFAIFRPSTGTWYIRMSTNDGVLIQPFGGNGDRPAINTR